MLKRKVSTKRELIRVVSWLSKNGVKYDLVRFDGKVIVTAFLHKDVFDIVKEGELLYMESFEEVKKDVTAREVIERLKREL